jgi:hypothetical protein
MAEIQQSAVILLNGFDLSCFLKTIEESATQDVLDATSFCTTDGARQFVVGLNERGISAEGFFAYNSVTDAFSVDKLLNDSLVDGVERLLTYGLQGTVDVGDQAVMMNLKHSSFNVQETIGEIIMTTFEGKATKDATQNPYARGIWLMNQTVAGAVNGTSYDDGAGATTGYYAQVHNTNSDGTATVKVQHSADNAIWADLIDFGAVASVGAEQARSTVASVDRYIRAIVTAIGGTTNKVSVAIDTGYSG